MSNFATYGGIKYSCLQTRYEGHVGNRNPILGTGHIAYDEASFNLEGQKGAGARCLGTSFSNLNSAKQQHQQQYSSTSSPSVSPSPNQYPPNPHHPNDEFRTIHARRDSFLNLAKDQQKPIIQRGGKKLFSVGENVNVIGSGGRTYEGEDQVSQFRLARNVNFNLRKSQQKDFNSRNQMPSPAKQFFNDNNNNNVTYQQQPQQQRQQQQQNRKEHSTFMEKNPITGEGHTAYDERECDLDGRIGAGTRGADGSSRRNKHRNVITGEGLRAYLSKNHSSQKVEDGECDSYAYYKDHLISGKELGKSYRPTSQLQWSHQKYEPHALPKQWHWSTE
jgi:hypothetical protein